MSSRNPKLHRRCLGSALPVLVLVQAIVAMIALAAIVFVGIKIGPLLEEKAQLESDIQIYKQEVSRLQIEIVRNREQVTTLKSELHKTREELDDTRERLAKTFEMSRFEHPIDPVDLKMIFSRFPKQARALELMLEMQQQDVGWHLGGQTPEVGFDSPSFAAFVLRELKALELTANQHESLLSRSRQLFSQLEPLDEPGVGDLVFYPAGYALFYYLDHDNKPFVIGMTPTGIVALEPDFAKPVGYRKTGLGE